MIHQLGDASVDAQVNYKDKVTLAGPNTTTIVAAAAVLPADWSIEEVLVRGNVGPLAESVEGTVLSWDSTGLAALDKWGVIFDLKVYEVRGTGQPSIGYHAEVGMSKDALDAYTVETPVVLLDTFASAITVSHASGVLEVKVTPDDITGTATTIYFARLQGEVYKYAP